MKEKVYCKNCVYVARAGGTLNTVLDNCLAPIDNWCSPTAPCNRFCSSKNHRNDCKDYEVDNDNSS